MKIDPEAIFSILFSRLKASVPKCWSQFVNDWKKITNRYKEVGKWTRMEIGKSKPLDLCKSNGSAPVMKCQSPAWAPQMPVRINVATDYNYSVLVAPCDGTVVFPKLDCGTQISSPGLTSLLNHPLSSNDPMSLNFVIMSVRSTFNKCLNQG